MKNVGWILLCLILGITLVHSGRTDSNGGHWDHSTGEYHYHHGYPAHQHPNGVCPYDNRNNSTSNTSPITETKRTIPENKSSTVIETIIEIISFIFVGLPSILFIVGWIISVCVIPAFRFLSKLLKRK